MNEKDKLRIGDSDRELVSRLLKSAVDEGRLTLAEYDERLQQVYEAKTVGDLTPITGDLMGTGRGVLAVSDHGELRTGAVRSVPVPRRGTPVWIKWMWFGWMVPVAICTTIWLIAFITGNGTQDFWPLWVAGPLGAVMGAVTLMERALIRPALQEADQRRLDRETAGR
ncbi:uncharacterized protein DUF1707 [Stackebrandtia albiflava]|uniref:Uncharacterized protein DUF1707 n=1 Tax=Stackebrandtia albiflava TaxID=406432 RepID=A0A562V3C6_9ACTN|nr:DUF1707 domain-containing protein [Stackebrandtia albiflava]TWJ12381.1 uncharacterized protein DUF1707 [Stackebrandtia albiflava]